MLQFWLVGMGGAIGAMLRFSVVRLSVRLLPGDFPYGVMAINIAGSLLMGLLVGYGARHTMSEEMRAFLSVGILGGFTTFSAFSLDVVTLLQRGPMLPAMLYLVGSVTLSVLGLSLGLMAMRAAG